LPHLYFQKVRTVLGPVIFPVFIPHYLCGCNPRGQSFLTFRHLVCIKLPFPVPSPHLGYPNVTSLGFEWLPTFLFLNCCPPPSLPFKICFQWSLFFLQWLFFFLFWGGSISLKKKKQNKTLAPRYNPDYFPYPFLFSPFSVIFLSFRASPRPRLFSVSFSNPNPHSTTAFFFPRAFSHTPDTVLPA